MSESPNPFEPAMSADAKPARPKRYSITAVSRPWVILAVLLVVARLIFMRLFIWADVAVPTLTLWLLWIYTPLFFFATGVVFLAIAGLFRSQEAQRRVGFVSLVLACGVGAALGMLGYLLPCLALWQNM